MAEASVSQVVAENSNIGDNVKVKNNEDISLISNDKLHDLLKDLSKFKVKKVLRNNTIQKLIAVVGAFENFDGDVLVIFEKKTFPDDQSILEQSFFNESILFNKIYHNDIYRGYDAYPLSEDNGLNATLIYPATQKHIEKWLPPQFFIIEETPELYKCVTLPALAFNDQFSIKWVDNILDGSAEVDRVIFNDTNNEIGFVLVKDSKWNDGLETLHLIALSRKPIKSLRELNSDHLPLLKNIKEAGTKVICDTYNLPVNKLRVFIHYQPSYYHFHVHFTVNTLENAGTNVERAHLLSTVISNIELMSDYYQKATITFCVCKLSDFKPYEDFMNDANSNVT